jgi:hypothetical protein
MTVGRDDHTATLLLDGRVLIAGGWGSDYRDVASAELYDPETGTFSATGSMTVGRAGATATLLLDGRVLVVGGWESADGGDPVMSASAELYDPETGIFTQTGSLPEARLSSTATRLLDGRVLVAGGGTASSRLDGDAAAELYDPQTGLFSPTGSMTSDRIFHTATLLRNGRVLIAGGLHDLSAELYDPATGTFSATGSMTIVEGGHVATLLSDGRVLVAGEAAEIYDPTAGTFTRTGPMVNACECGLGGLVTAPLLADGRVLVPDDRGSAQLYDPLSGTFSQAGPMSRHRYTFTDTLLADGRVLFVGARGPVCLMVCPSMTPDDDADRASAELYVP